MMPKLTLADIPPKVRLHAEVYHVWRIWSANGNLSEVTLTDPRVWDQAAFNLHAKTDDEAAALWKDTGSEPPHWTLEAKHKTRIATWKAGKF